MTGDDFKRAMAGVCGPVTVVTTRRADGKPHGTTVSAMASLSLDPPMVTVSLADTSRLLAAVRETGRIGINVLSHGQDDLAMTFGSSAENQFEAVDWSWDDGLPRLAGAGVWLVGEVREFVDGGDHHVLLTLVTGVDVEDLPPLVYARRTFGTHSGLVATAVRDISPAG